MNRKSIVMNFKDKQTVWIPAQSPSSALYQGQLFNFWFLDSIGGVRARLSLRGGEGVTMCKVFL